MSVSLPPDKLADIQQLALSLLQTQHVTVHRVMSFLGKANICTNGHCQLWHLCHVIQRDMLHVYHSPTHFFLEFIFPFPPYINWNSYLICNRTWFLCNFHSLMWLLLLMPHPLIGPFIFRDLVYLYQLVDPGWVFCAGLILPCRSFRPLPWCCVEWPYTYLVRWLPCIWITAWIRLICVIKVVQCLLFFQAGLPDTESDQQAQYYSYSTIHSYPPQCGGQLSVLGSDASRVASPPSAGWSSFLPLGPSRGGPAGILSFHSMPALLHLGIPTTSGCLGVEYLQPSLDISGKLHVSSSCICSSSSVQVSGRTCQRPTHMFDSGGTMLIGGYWAHHSSQHLGRCSSMLPIIKDLIMDVSVSQVHKGLSYLHLTLWLLSNMCYADRGSLPQSVRWWWGQLKHLHQRSTSNVGRNGQVGVFNRVHQTMPFLPLN